MSSTLEDLLNVSGKASINELIAANMLDLRSKGLIHLPEAIGQLGALTGLWLHNNQLSSLPESIGQLTNLDWLWLDNNPISELPESITLLRKLKYLKIESQGIRTIERAPLGITALPCYTNTSNPYSDVSSSIAESLRQLKLYKYDDKNLTDISSLIGELKVSNRINISNNKISTLPDEISTLTILRELNFANNMFTIFPDVLLKMTWLTSLDVSGNSITELPAGLTALTRLAVLVIAETSGKFTIQRAPLGISTLPCYGPNAYLKQLIFFDPYVPTAIPAHLHLEQRIGRVKSDRLQSKPGKLTNSKAPILAPIDLKVHKVSQLACNSGTLCLLCLKVFDDPCALDCSHIFCTSCVTGAIQESKLRPPFACPICHQTSITSHEVSESMKIAADEFKKKADIFDKQQTNPELLTQKCKNRTCQEKATHYCSTCGIFCQEHLGFHNKANDDHIDLVSEVKPGSAPAFSKMKCPMHQLEIKYYCAECLIKPFKCSECLADDHKTAEQKQHEYVKYREIDTQQFKDFMQKELDLLMARAKITQDFKTNMDEERTKCSQNFASFRARVNQFIDDLQKNVDQLRANIMKQLDNIEEECNRELQHKFNELRADDERLKLSQELMNDAIENFRDMTPSEVDNILKLSKETLSIPVRKLLFKPVGLTERLPKDLLLQLDRLNRQILVGTTMENSADQISSPASVTRIEHLQSFIFDQDSEQYFGVSKQTPEVLNVDKQMKVVQKSSPNLCINTEFHDLQGISLSNHGVLAVVDALANTVTLFDKESMIIGMVIRKYCDSEDILFHTPCDVAFDSRDRLFVVDSGSKSIIIFDENFEFTQIIKISEEEVGSLEYSPRMIEIGAKDELYVYCSGSESIVVLDKDFNFVEAKSVH